VTLPRPSQQSFERALALSRARPFRLALGVSLGLVGLAAAALTGMVSIGLIKLLAPWL
jgi:hypothetical protein